MTIIRIYLSQLTTAVFLFILHNAFFSSEGSVIGVTFSPNRTRLSPDHVPELIQSLKFSAVRLPESTPAAIRSFTYFNTSLLITIPNALVSSMAENESNAIRWLYANVVPFYPRAHISTISVGDDVLAPDSDIAPDDILPAIRNIHLALSDIGIRKIAVSTTFSFTDIMTTSFPPSSAQFQDPAMDSLILPLLGFLEDTNSSFLVNLFPYHVYRLHSEIPIGYALFEDRALNFRDDSTTGVRYENLFDMMADAVICAMAVAGHQNIPLVVTETGWPSEGENEADANRVYAEMYLKGLIRHLESGLGTPLRKEGVAETYIYELLDEEDGSDSGRQWGILYSNTTSKYNFEFSASKIESPLRGLIQLLVQFFLLL